MVLAAALLVGTTACGDAPEGDILDPRASGLVPHAIEDLRGFAALPGCTPQKMLCGYTDDTKEEAACVCDGHAIPPWDEPFRPEDLIIVCPEGSEPSCWEEDGKLVCDCGPVVATGGA